MTIAAPAVSQPQVVDVTVVTPAGTSAKSSNDLLFYDSFLSEWYVHGYTAASSDGKCVLVACAGDLATTAYTAKQELSKGDKTIKLTKVQTRTE